MSFHLPGVKPGSDIESLFKAIGFVVVQWGSAEQSLDLIVAAIFHRFVGNPLLKRRPRMLAAKLDLLRNCFQQLPGLEQFRADGEALLSRFAIAGNKRHDLVHGAIANLSIENGAFTFAKIDVNQDGHSVRTVVLDQSKFPYLIKELLRLGDDANKLGRSIWETTKKYQ
jgi:hypothetical protein